MATLYNDAELQELHRQAEYMNQPPFNTPPTKHAKAVAAVLAGRVHAADDPVHPWQVAGEKDSPQKRILYMVNTGGCSCPHAEKTNQGRYGCYHAVATELYDRWQKALQPSLFTAPKTADERVAAPPQETPQEATSAPVEASTAQDVPAVVFARDPALEAPSAPETAPTPRLTLQLPRRSIHAIVTDLSRPLPSACIPTLPQGATEVRFLHWHQVTRLLDTYAPGWDGCVTRLEKVGKTWALTYRLTIPCLPEGTFPGRRRARKTRR